MGYTSWLAIGVKDIYPLNHNKLTYNGYFEMTTIEYEDLKSKFLKIFANIPNPLRDEIIVVIGGDTYDWRTAKAEIMNDSEQSIEILRRLKEIEVI